MGEIEILANQYLTQYISLMAMDYYWLRYSWSAGRRNYFLQAVSVLFRINPLTLMLVRVFVPSLMSLSHRDKKEHTAT